MSEIRWQRGTRTLQIWRGDMTGGELVDYDLETEPGMVVLDAVLEIQRSQAPDLAVRWNCKAAKCGSCSAEVNGKPRLMCKTRLDHLPTYEPITVEPMRAFPLIRDLVTDVSWNYRVNEQIPPFTPRDDLKEGVNLDGDFLIDQADTDRMSEFRKCIECFMCQDVCHVLRDHRLHNQLLRPTLHGPHGEPRHAPARRRSTGSTRSPTRAASASATSPSAAPRSAPRASTSPTTRSSR